MTIFLIAMLIFNYVNTTMFWHCHLVDGQIIFHSHIYGKSHHTGNSDGGHTRGQLQFLDYISHTLFTDSVIPDVHVGFYEVLLCEFRPADDSSLSLGFFSRALQRGPPSMV